LLQPDNETEIETAEHNDKEEQEEEEEKTKVDTINQEEEIKKRITTLADTVNNFQIEYVKTRKTVKEQLLEIRDLGLHRFN
jgi:hypothetical protein